MSMLISCPKCSQMIDMNDHGDVFYNDDELNVECTNCQAEFYVEPVVAISFVVGDIINE